MTAVEDAIARWVALVALGLGLFWVLVYMTQAKPKRRKRMRAVQDVTCWCVAFGAAPRDCYCVGFDSNEDGAH